MYLFERHIKDKAVSTFIRRRLQVGAIDPSGEVAERCTARWCDITITCNIYLHELDKELEKRNHRFVRYADDFVIFVKTKRAGERVMDSIKHSYTKPSNLKSIMIKVRWVLPPFKVLELSNEQSKWHLSFQTHYEAKRNLKRNLKWLTRRSRPGSFQDIITEINRVTRGWINYFGKDS